ncbi:MAG: hypothetical protein ABF488_11445 [Lentilactobacillus hilgardii]
MPLGLTCLLILAEIGLALSHGQYESWVIGGISILIFIGTEAFNTPSNTLIMSSVPTDLRGMAGASNSLAREFGMVLGTTLATSTFYGSLSLFVGRTSLTATGQPHHYLFFAQSVAYCVATLLLILGLWIIRPAKMRAADGDQS